MICLCYSVEFEVFDVRCKIVIHSQWGNCIFSTMERDDFTSNKGQMKGPVLENEHQFIRSWFQSIIKHARMEPIELTI